MFKKQNKTEKQFSREENKNLYMLSFSTCNVAHAEDGISCLYFESHLPSFMMCNCMSTYDCQVSGFYF